MLSNYWDIIANKGSYKSLLNAIEWFEWDDTLTLKEIYKHVEANRFMFNDAFISPTFVDNINDSFGNFINPTILSCWIF